MVLATARAFPPRMLTYADLGGYGRRLGLVDL